MQIELDKIKANPRQPRKHFEGIQELSDSIAKKGLIQAITVRPQNGGYEIITGERRYRACKLAGLKTIEANVMEADDRLAYELALVENVQRDSLTPIDEAQSFQDLQAGGYNQKAIGELIGKSQQYVAGRLSLLKLSKPVQEMITTRVVSASIGQRLASIGDEKEQLRLAKKVESEGISTREVERILRNRQCGGDLDCTGIQDISDKMMELSAIMGVMKEGETVTGLTKGKGEADSVTIYKEGEDMFSYSFCFPAFTHEGFRDYDRFSFQNSNEPIGLSKLVTYLNWREKQKCILSDQVTWMHPGIRWPKSRREIMNSKLTRHENTHREHRT